MKTLASALQTHLSARAPILDRNLIWITAIGGTTYGFHDGDLNETVTVTNPATGTGVSRAYLGGGHIVGIPDSQDTPDLSIRTVQFELSGASSSVLSMLGATDMRGAKIEWHKAFLKPDTYELIATPACEFDGFINGLSRSESALDLESDDGIEPIVTLVCVSHIRELTRTSAKTRSYRHGLERSGDEIFRYCGGVGRWNIRWGSEKKSHAEKHGGGGKRHKGGRP